MPGKDGKPLVNELRAELKRLGLNYEGKKAELMERLEIHRNKEAKLERERAAIHSLQVANGETPTPYHARELNFSKNNKSMPSTPQQVLSVIAGNMDDTPAMHMIKHGRSVPVPWVQWLINGFIVAFLCIYKLSAFMTPLMMLCCIGPWVVMQIASTQKKVAS